MAQLLKRDDRLIFSKLQKHIQNLVAVEAFINKSLKLKLQSMIKSEIKGE